MCGNFFFLNHELWSKQLQKIKLVQPLYSADGKTGAKCRRAWPRAQRQDARTLLPQHPGATFQRPPTSYSPFNLRHNQPCQLLPHVAPRREWEEYSALYWGGGQWGVVKDLSPSSLALSLPPFPPPKPPSMGTPQNQVPFHTPSHCSPNGPVQPPPKSLLARLGPLSPKALS